LATEQAFDDMN